MQVWCSAQPGGSGPLLILLHSSAVMHPPPIGQGSVPVAQGAWQPMPP